MTWYDVWNTLCINFSFSFFFWKQIRIDLHFIIISNSWNHSTLIFFFYFSKPYLFLMISFETLFEWHAWNCQGLENAWMRWWRLTRKIPQFKLVSGHKMCLVFPNYWWYEGNDRDFKNLRLVWEPRIVLRCKLTTLFLQLASHHLTFT